MHVCNTSHPVTTQSTIRFVVLRPTCIVGGLACWLVDVIDGQSVWHVIIKGYLSIDLSVHMRIMLRWTPLIRFPWTPNSHYSLQNLHLDLFTKRQRSALNQCSVCRRSIHYYGHFEANSTRNVSKPQSEAIGGGLLVTVFIDICKSSDLNLRPSELGSEPLSSVYILLWTTRLLEFIYFFHFITPPHIKACIH